MQGSFVAAWKGLQRQPPKGKRFGSFWRGGRVACLCQADQTLQAHWERDGVHLYQGMTAFGRERMQTAEQQRSIFTEIYVGYQDLYFDGGGPKTLRLHFKVMHGDPGFLFFFLALLKAWLFHE